MAGRMLRSCVVLLAAGIVVACGGASVPEATPTSTPTPTPSPVPPTATATATATPTPAPTATPGLLAGLVTRPLADLSAEAAAYFAGRPGILGLAVVVPSAGVIYSANGGRLISTASIVKVPIMLTVMDAAIRDGRGLTLRELALLGRMITVSDNDATLTLWEELGGGEAVDAYMRALGLPDFVPGPGERWLPSRLSANEAALLLAKLAEGELLDEESRALALDLMTNIIQWQRWGVNAGVPSGAVVALKNGWGNTATDWFASSAGIVFPANGGAAYTIAVFTEKQSEMEEGVETIETVAALIHAALR